MAYVYAVIVVFDFILFPIFWNILQVRNSITLTEWKPLTLEQTGFIHLTFLTILGITSWTRGKEKEALIQATTKETSDDKSTQ